MYYNVWFSFHFSYIMLICVEFGTHKKYSIGADSAQRKTLNLFLAWMSPWHCPASILVRNTGYPVIFLLSTHWDVHVIYLTLTRLNKVEWYKQTQLRLSFEGCLYIGMENVGSNVILLQLEVWVIQKVGKIWFKMANIKCSPYSWR